MAYAILTREKIEIEALIARVVSNHNGAYVVFTGNVRDHDSGRSVNSLTYTAYEELAAKELLSVAESAEERWPIAVAIAHRIGSIAIGEASVIVIAASAHRADAFDAARWAIDTIKTTVPIWKQEEYSDGQAVWIEGDQQVPIAAVTDGL